MPPFVAILLSLRLGADLSGIGLWPVGGPSFGTGSFFLALPEEGPTAVSGGMMLADFVP
jgi:hypothetical protein